MLIFLHSKSLDSFAELVKFVLARFSLLNKWYVLSSSEAALQQDLYLYIRSYLQKEIENVREMMDYCFDHLPEDVDQDKKSNHK